MQQLAESVMFYLNNKINCDYLHESKVVEISTIFSFFILRKKLQTFSIRSYTENYHLRL